eukprot:5114753-Pyramimonas_sp.AAC.1
MPFARPGRVVHTRAAPREDGHLGGVGARASAHARRRRLRSSLPSSSSNSLPASSSLALLL